MPEKNHDKDVRDATEGEDFPVHRGLSLEANDWDVDDNYDGNANEKGGKPLEEKAAKTERGRYEQNFTNFGDVDDKKKPQKDNA
jgi:hypothetical protein